MAVQLPNESAPPPKPVAEERTSTVDIDAKPQSEKIFRPDDRQRKELRVKPQTNETPSSDYFQKAMGVVPQSDVGMPSKAHPLKRSPEAIFVRNQAGIMTAQIQEEKDN